MKIKNCFHVLVALSVLGASSAMALDCEKPTQPIIPDGNVASEDELVAASKAVKAYQTNLGTYRDCLSESTLKIDTEAEGAEQQSAALLEQFNASVDDETTIAEKLNSAIRAFKSRG